MGNTNFAVKFNELQTAFNELQTKFNTHTHITTATVGATPTPGTLAPTTSTSTANISAAKNQKIKTN